MRRLLLVLIAFAGALAMTPAALSQDYNFTYTIDNNVIASGSLGINGTASLTGNSVVSGLINFDGNSYGLWGGSVTPPATLTSPSEMFLYDNFLYALGGPGGYLSTTGGLLFVDPGVGEINIWSNSTGLHDSFYVWDDSLQKYVFAYDKVGDFNLTAVPEFSGLSTFLLCALTLAGGLFVKARQTGLHPSF